MDHISEQEWLDQLTTLVNAHHNAGKRAADIVNGEVVTEKGVHRFRVKRDKDGRILVPSATDFADRAPISPTIAAENSAYILKLLYTPDIDGQGERIAAVQDHIKKLNGIANTWMTGCPEESLSLQSFFIDAYEGPDVEEYHQYMFEQKQIGPAQVEHLVTQADKRLAAYFEWFADPNRKIVEGPEEEDAM